ncbi:MAG: hypothetical protein JOZ80_12605 [Acidobacteriaceae bacterium]|nr:hypothetical protein [Acidobacteriaceae bacterium]
MECVCAEATALAGLKKAGLTQSHIAKNRTPDLYHRIRDTWEVIDGPKLVIDTDASIDACVERARRYLVNPEERGAEGMFGEPLSPSSDV